MSGATRPMSSRASTLAPPRVMRIHQTGEDDAVGRVDQFISGERRVSRRAKRLDHAIANEDEAVGQLAVVVVEGGDGVRVFDE